MKNYEIKDRNGKSREIRVELKDLVGQKVEFEGMMTKCYEDSHKLLVRDVYLIDENGNKCRKVANHCNMMIKANLRNDKGRQKEQAVFDKVKEKEGKRVKFVGEVRNYSKNGIDNVGISKFIRLIEE